jgi:hypothetical protein
MTSEPVRDADYVAVPRAQLELILWSLEGFLNLFVEDWRADAPVAKQPWAGNANECWDAIGQARVLCGIIERKLT